MDDIENELGKKKVRKTSSKNNPVQGRSFFLKLFSFVFFLVAAYLGFMYYKTSNELNAIKNPEKQKAILEKKISDVVSEISKVININSDDKPVFAGIVEDPEVLKKEQEFFKDAQVGDYVFVFEKTSKAMIWNPTKKIIVNFGVYSQSEKQNENSSAGSVDKDDTKSIEKK